MDRPRERKGTPFTREVARLARAGLLIVAIVLGVGALPVIFLWWYADDLDDAVNLAYRDEDVEYAAADGVRLVGRLRLPPYDGPHPALVVAHGSGRTTHEGYDDLGRDLALNGFALLTYDKRGVGESGGVYQSVGVENSETALTLLADDVIAGVEFLRQRDDIRADQVGVLGVSQGGWIGPLAAARTDAIAFVALISGPAVSVGDEIFYSDLTGEQEGGTGPSDSELSARLAAHDGPDGYDPHSTLEALDVPSLWILGAADRSIPVPETVAALERLRGAGRPIEIQLLPGVGHGMHDVRSGQPAPVFPILFGWLVQQTAPR